MDNRPIGVFDSGLGGLTAVREIKKIMQGEDIIYFGDTGRVPYGTRSKDTILKYTRQDINFLKSKNIKTIVVACGTVSSVALDIVANEIDIPIIGVVKPAVNAAISYKKGQKIGIIGTTSTIKSGSYQRIIEEISQNNDLEIETFAKDCPLFVPLVENGRIGKDDKVSKLVVEEYLNEFREKNIDTLILGCTHYPLLSDIISQFMGEHVKLVDPGKETAKCLLEEVSKSDRVKGKTQYFVTDDAEGFSKNAKIFLGEEIENQTKIIDITAY